MIELDCGDNSCYFKKSSGGMRTNGGCRCFRNAGFNGSLVANAIKMLPELLELRILRDKPLNDGSTDNGDKKPD